MSLLFWDQPVPSSAAGHQAEATFLGKASPNIPNVTISVQRSEQYEHLIEIALHV